MTCDTSGNRSDVVDGYEQLRARALGGQADGWRLGLGVLQQRGMAAWLRVRQATAPRHRSRRRRHRRQASIDAELVGLLASMVLAVAARG